MKLNRIMSIILAMVVALAALPVSSDTASASTAVTRGAMSAYYKVVTDTINRVGIALEQDIWSARGLVQAELIDFDKDGVSELFLFYLESGQHVEEVWSFKNNKVGKIHSFNWQISGRVYDMAVSIATTKNKAYIVHQSGYSASGFNDDFEHMYSDIRTFHTIVNGKFVEVDWLEDLDEELAGGNTRKTYNQKLNGKEKKITASAYKQGLSKYNYDKRKIIMDSDGTGFKTLAINMKNNGKTLYDFIMKLKSGMRSTSLNNTYVQLKAEEKNELTAFLHSFSSVSNLTTNKSFSDAQIAKFLMIGIHNGSFRKYNFTLDPDNEPIIKDREWYYYPYPKSKVDQLTKKLFGKTIPAKNYEQIEFTNGNFYILSPNYGSDPSQYSPQVNSLYALGNGLFYAEFVISALNGTPAIPF